MFGCKYTEDLKKKILCFDTIYINTKTAEIAEVYKTINFTAYILYISGIMYPHSGIYLLFTLIMVISTLF